MLMTLGQRFMFAGSAHTKDAQIAYVMSLASRNIDVFVAFTVLITSHVTIL